MRRFVCNSILLAEKIKKFEEVTTKHSDYLIVTLENGEEIETTMNLCHTYNLNQGHYFVIYENGDMAVMHPDSFERKYTEVV